MHQLGNRNIVSFVVAVLLVISACKEQPPAETEPKRKSGNAKPASTTTTTTGGSSNDDDDDSGTSGSGGTGSNSSGSDSSGSDSSGSGSDSSSSDSSDAISSGSGTDCGSSSSSGGSVPNYEDDIKSIVEEKCLKCHSADKKEPDLSDYDKLVGDAAGSLRAIDKDRMPPEDEPGLTTGERKKIRAWVEGGKPKTRINAGNGSGSGTDCGSDGSGSDVNSGSDPSGWEDLLNPPAMKECKAKDLVYDRGADKCHVSKIATSFDCSKTAILDKFKAMNVNITTQYEALEADGYVIDQCGEVGSEPVVFFYKKIDGTNELQLKFKKFCKKGSPACG